MTNIKSLGTWVRLADGKVGHIAGATIDGYSVIVDGRIVTTKDVTPIPSPAAAEHPEPVRTPQRPIQTSHEPIPFPNRPSPRGVLVDGRWSDPQ
jgi:hypothetical protein